MNNVNIYEALNKASVCLGKEDINRLETLLSILGSDLSHFSKKINIYKKISKKDKILLGNFLKEGGYFFDVTFVNSIDNKDFAFILNKIGLSFYHFFSKKEYKYNVCSFPLHGRFNEDWNVLMEETVEKLPLVNFKNIDEVWINYIWFLAFNFLSDNKGDYKRKWKDFFFEYKIVKNSAWAEYLKCADFTPEVLSNTMKNVFLMIEKQKDLKYRHLYEVIFFKSFFINDVGDGNARLFLRDMPLNKLKIFLDEFKAKGDEGSVDRLKALCYEECLSLDRFKSKNVLNIIKYKELLEDFVGINDNIAYSIKSLILFKVKILDVNKFMGFKKIDIRDLFHSIELIIKAIVGVDFFLIDSHRVVNKNDFNIGIGQLLEILEKHPVLCFHSAHIEAISSLRIERNNIEHSNDYSVFKKMNSKEYCDEIKSGILLYEWLVDLFIDYIGKKKGAYFNQVNKKQNRYVFIEKSLELNPQYVSNKYLYDYFKQKLKKEIFIKK